MARMRSLLSVPGSDWNKIQKAVASPADQVLIDLEDAVAPNAKADARLNVIRAARELDWGGKPVAYRINGLDTAYCYRDIIDVVEQAGEAVDLIVVPKVAGPEDLFFVSTLLSQLELHRGAAPDGIRLGAQIESAAGITQADRIAKATDRLTALHFGPADYAASVRMPMTAIGVRNEWDDAYPGHRFHYAMAQVVNAACAAGIEAIDGPFADFRDPEGLRASCRTGRALGFTGKWCIHPSQIAIVHEVFSPSAQEIAWARRIVEAYDAANDAGKGAVTFAGGMIDAASIRLAKSILGS
jgi:citrate lyase subunit beta/citryl-CoA lyase